MIAPPPPGRDRMTSTVGEDVLGLLAQRTSGHGPQLLADLDALRPLAESVGRRAAEVLVAHENDVASIGQALSRRYGTDVPLAVDDGLVCALAALDGSERVYSALLDLVEMLEPENLVRRARASLAPPQGAS